MARLRARDVAVIEMSRPHGVDLFSGRGLFRALAGVDVVIDVSNPPPGRPGGAGQAATRRRTRDLSKI